MLEEGERKGERVQRMFLCICVLLFVEYSNIRQSEAQKWLVKRRFRVTIKEKQRNSAKSLCFNHIIAMEVCNLRESCYINLIPAV